MTNDPKVKGSNTAAAGTAERHKRSEQVIRSELPLIKILRREDRIRLRYSDLEFILSPVLLLFFTSN
jgi:hypothetical protein